MSTEKHYTSGPWKVFKAKNDSTSFIGIGETTGGGVLDAGFVVWRDGPEVMANANLAAAAPDLLEALEAIVVYEEYPDFPKWAGYINNARAAIWKAKGGS